MDFNLTEQEKSVRQAAHDFADKSIRPIAAEIDKTNTFPIELSLEMGKLGYRGMHIPTEYGGSGAGYLSYSLALEQICKPSVAVGAITAINGVHEEAIYRFGTEEQKQRLLKPLAQGKMLGCMCFTEAETGSDPRSVHTTARKVDGGYIVTGQKQFISSAKAADLALVWAKQDDKGIDAFVVETASKGYHVREQYETMGLRGLGTSTVDMEEVFVPAGNLLLEEGRGFEVLLEAISVGRLGVALEALALGQEALDLSIKYALQRHAQGRPIAKLPTIQTHIAEMHSRIEATRWLVYHTAFMRDQGLSIRHDSSVAKLFASQMAVDVTRMAMEVHGSQGTMTSMPIERLYRDAKMLEIYVGVAEIQRAIIASNLI
jgi:alkylation response protein AidB-like acyl-CoA dehydrogenase